MLYPIISFTCSILLIIVITLFSDLTARNLFLLLASIFAAFSVLGSLDELFGVTIGLFLAEKLCLVESSKLDNMEYEMDVKGNISKGISTIEVSLTLLWVLIFAFLG